MLGFFLCCAFIFILLSIGIPLYITSEREYRKWLKDTKQQRYDLLHGKNNKENK
jgi:hypothetical protein